MHVCMNFPPTWTYGPPTGTVSVQLYILRNKGFANEEVEPAGAAWLQGIPRIGEEVSTASAGIRKVVRVRYVGFYTNVYLSEVEISSQEEKQ